MLVQLCRRVRPKTEWELERVGPARRSGRPGTDVGQTEWELEPARNGRLARAKAGWTAQFSWRAAPLNLLPHTPGVPESRSYRQVQPASIGLNNLHIRGVSLKTAGEPPRVRPGQRRRTRPACC
jgi:hypothetical protein